MRHAYTDHPDGVQADPDGCTCRQRERHRCCRCEWWGCECGWCKGGHKGCQCGLKWAWGMCGGWSEGQGDRHGQRGMGCECRCGGHEWHNPWCKCGHRWPRGCSGWIEGQGEQHKWLWSPIAVPYPISLSAHHSHQGTGKKEASEKRGDMVYYNQAHPLHTTQIQHMYLRPLKLKCRPKYDSEGSKPQEHEAGMVGKGARGVVTVDNHMCLMGWDMIEMGMKQNTMTRMKNHTHSICMPA